MVYALAAALALHLTEVDPGALVAATLAPLAIASHAVLLVFLGASLYPFGLDCFTDAGAWATVVVRVVVGLAVGLLAIVLLPVSRGVMEAIVAAAIAPPATRAMALIGSASRDLSRPGSVNLGTVLSLAAMIVLLIVDW